MLTIINANPENEFVAKYQTRIIEKHLLTMNDLNKAEH